MRWSDLGTDPATDVFYTRRQALMTGQEPLFCSKTTAIARRGVQYPTGLLSPRRGRNGFHCSREPRVRMAEYCAKIKSNCQNPIAMATRFFIFRQVPSFLIRVPSVAKDCGVWNLISRPARSLNRKTGIHSNNSVILSKKIA